MKVSVFLHLLFFLFLTCGKSFGQNDFDVESPLQEDIFLYDKPQKGEVVALIPDGETLTSLESTKYGENTWHKVKYGDYTGFVNGKYLTPSAGKRKAIVTYQQANITKLVLIHAVSQSDGFCYLLNIDNKTQQVKIKNRFKCKFGANGLVKQKEGDKKTPLGHYCVVSKSAIKNDTSTVEDDEVYNKFGGYNIHLNYPNVHDAVDKKTGGGICIHGGYSRATEGCVRIIDDGQAISTKNIVTVGNFVSKGTHVMITNTVPESFKQKTNTTLPADSYSFIQTACGKVCSYADWKYQVDNFFTSFTSGLTYPTAATTPTKASAAKTIPTNTTKSDAVGYASGRIKSPTGSANIRQKPNKDAAVVERIANNQTILYKATGSAWWEVVTEQGNKGYIHSSLIGK